MLHHICKVSHLNENFERELIVLKSILPTGFHYKSIDKKLARFKNCFFYLNDLAFLTHVGLIGTWSTAPPNLLLNPALTMYPKSTSKMHFWKKAIIYGKPHYLGVIQIIRDTILALLRPPLPLRVTFFIS